MFKTIGSSLLVLIFCCALSHAQRAIRDLPKNINQPSVNLYAPFISGDGRSMIYLSDYTDDGHHVMYYATRKGVTSWNDGEEIDKVINRPTHNFRGGYSLNFDGSMLLYTSRKSGLGGFEIWYSEKISTGWGPPKNMGAPINSASNEGSPMISPDGQYLYFMRCESMTEYKGAKGCKLMVSKWKYNKWGEPEELPAHINTGNSQTPRILADGETLFFSSDQFGGKGYLDLYMTRKVEDQWTEPVPLDFVNDEWNNAFVSVPSKGRYLFVDVKGARSRTLTQILIPKEFKPKGVMRIQGNVVDMSGAPVNANLTVFNIDERKRLWNEKIGNRGEFTLVLNEGASYDLSVTDGDENMYYSKIYRLDSIGPRDRQKLKVIVEPVELNRAYETPIGFELYTSELSDDSIFELRRLAGLMRKNQDMKIEIGVHLENYVRDSIQSNQDLTEIMADSIIVEKRVPKVMDLGQDSTLSVAMDSVVSDSLVSDSLSTESVGLDSVFYEIVEEIQIKYTYHNDRTEKQGESIKEYLIGRGINEERISIKVSRSDAQESILETEKTMGNPKVSFTIQGL
ncbi:MAG: hypothetical protein AAFN93_02610 [Bacteroidota bacterium]